MNSSWKSAWTVLLISAFTDAILAGYAALMAAMSTDSTSINKLTWVSIAAGMIAAAARTVQQALKATTADSAALKGQEVQVTTVTPDGIVQSNPTPKALSVAVNIPNGGIGDAPKP